MAAAKATILTLGAPRAKGGRAGDKSLPWYGSGNRANPSSDFQLATRRMSELIISVSGLRGVVGRSLTDEVAARFAAAFADTLGDGQVVVAYDGRASGPALVAAVCQALTAAGHDALVAGVAATPTVGALVRQHAAAGGVQISASHNPAEYNGMKLFSREGRVLTAASGREVLERFNAGHSTSAATRAGRQIALADTTERHLQLVLATVDVEAIRRRRFNVVLDANHGSGGVLGRKLLEALGCQTTVLGESPDGAFEHTPEPTEENLRGVTAKAKELAADVVFCQDPDADRLAVIDEAGRYIGEELTLPLCVDHVLRDLAGAVVTNSSTSRMSEDVATRHRVPFARSAVGEANVVELMESYDAVIGGEGNGGVIDPRVGYVRDSFAGMALLLGAMTAQAKTMSQLADDLPRYEIVKTKMPLSREKLVAAYAALERHFAAAAADRLDGLRLDWADQWLLVRASNTEPIVRAVAEAPTEAEARRLCDEAARVMAEL